MATIETLDGLKRKTTITLDKEAIQTELNKRLKDLSKRVRLDGFRPGKVPVNVVKKMHGEEVKNEIINDQVSQQYRTFLEEHKELKPAGYPEISPIENDEFSFEVNFEVMPEFELKGLETLKATKVESEVLESDIDAMIERLQKQQSTWVTVDRAAQMDDRLKIDFVGRVEGEEFEGGKGEDVPLVLGSNSMIPGFEEQLVGALKDEKRTITVTFPDDYHAENLKGKEAEFSITVHEVSEIELPEVNEDFVKSLGVEDGDVVSFKKELKKNMERELKATLQNKFKQSLFEALAEANEIDIPETLINAEVQNMAQQSNFPEPKDHEQAHQLMEIAKQSFGEEAKKRARLGLIIAKLVEEKEIKLDDKYVDARLEMLAETYEDPEEVKNHFRSNNENMQQIRNIALEDQIIDVLQEQATITAESQPFQEVMGQSLAN